MPAKASRVRRWLKEGKAKVVHNDLDLFQVQLTQDAATETQACVVGIDPGKLYSGMAVQTQLATLALFHLVLPFKRVKERMGKRRELRRTRRGRRINRTVAFKQRHHWPKRFDNRRGNKLAPSIKANRILELRVVKELVKLFPISSIVYEVVKADVDLTSGRKGAKSGKGFSPVMVGQKYMLSWLADIAPVLVRYGFQKDGNGTSQIRKYLGLRKTSAKKRQVPAAHAVDGVALAASQFVEFKGYQTRNAHGADWSGNVAVQMTAPFKVIARPAFYRRQLHFENFQKGGTLKRKGGTVTPFGFRSGDKVQATKAGKSFIGWIGGYTNSAKSKLVSIYDCNWKRVGQFVILKTKLLQRSTGLVCG